MAKPPVLDSLNDAMLSHDHQRCIHQALSLAEKLCAERGVRLTPLRRRVLELILEDHRAVKAYDLLDRIKPKHAVKPATVYRALDFLIAQGLIHKLERLNAFIGCGLSDRPHDGVLLICSRCGQVKELVAPEPATELMAAIRQTGFTPAGQLIEILGLCADCVGSLAGKT